MALLLLVATRIRGPNSIRQVTIYVYVGRLYMGIVDKQLYN